MKLETQIRIRAMQKVRVRITGKKRSKHGFFVTGPDGINICKTKREARSNLLARIRCSKQIDWRIDPVVA